MKSILLSAFFAPILMSTSLALAGSVHSVKVQLMNSAGKNIGTAVISPIEKGVEIRIEAKDLPAGEHGMHFHKIGKCIAPDFKSAGDHFAGDQQHHGLKNSGGPHWGDLPNLKVESDGSVNATFVSTRVTLKAAENSLLKEGGTALVIHKDEDDLTTDPSGKSGERIACGVISKRG